LGRRRLQPILKRIESADLEPAQRELTQLPQQAEVGFSFAGLSHLGIALPKPDTFILCFSRSMQSVFDTFLEAKESHFADRLFKVNCKRMLNRRESWSILSLYRPNCLRPFLVALEQIKDAAFQENLETAQGR
jgi:hypothetical protein